MIEWYIFVPTVCGALAALVSIWRRQWTFAIAMACIATFMLFNNLLLNVAPTPVKYVLFVVGAILIAIEQARIYKKYKESLLQ